jgi:Cu/Ag efflux pump CusA
VVTVTFADGTDIYQARQMVGERLLEIASQMPQGVAAPIMAPLTSATSTIMSIGLTAEARSSMDLRTFADWTLRPRLLAVPGVAKVSIYGGGERELQIQIDPARLLAHGVSIDDVLSAASRLHRSARCGFCRDQEPARRHPHGGSVDHARPLGRGRSWLP